MEDQLAMFEVQLPATEIGAAWSQLPHAQRETPLRLLAELMARSVADEHEARNISANQEDGNE